LLQNIKQQKVDHTRFTLLAASVEQFITKTNAKIDVLRVFCELRVQSHFGFTMICCCCCLLLIVALSRRGGREGKVFFHFFSGGFNFTVIAKTLNSLA